MEDVQLTEKSAINPTQPASTMVSTIWTATPTTPKHNTPSGHPSVDRDMDPSGRSADGPLEEEQSPTFTPLLCVLTLLAGLGGFLFGYDTGVISGALLLLKDVFQLSTPLQEAVVAVTTAGAALCAVLGGVGVIDAVGRRPAVLAASVVFGLSAVILAGAYGTWSLLTGRLVAGLAIGLVSVTVPIYIAECAPARVRGSLVTVFQVNIAVGMFLAVVMDALFSYDTQNGWRYMFGLSAVPALVQLGGMYFMPESPRWLVSRDRKEEARDVLQRLRGTPHVDGELLDICSKHQQEEQLSATNKSRWSVLLRMFQEPHIRRTLLVGCGLQMFQQIVGINTVMYYSATIIQMVGIPDNATAIWLAAAVSAVNVVFTFVGIYLVDRWGRRPLLLVSITGVLVSLVVLAIGFSVAENTTAPITANYTNIYSNNSKCSTYSWCNDCVLDAGCGYCGDELSTSCLPVDPTTLNPTYGACAPGSNSSAATWSYGSCESPYGWVVVVGMGLYLMSFAIGMGPIPWAMNSEIYPMWARGTGCAIATGTNWTFNLLVSMTFLTLSEVLTKPGVFWLYAGITLLALAFTYLWVPETKGMSLESIEQLFYTRQWAYQRL